MKVYIKQLGRILDVPEDTRVCFKHTQTNQITLLEEFSMFVLTAFYMCMTLITCYLVQRAVLQRLYQAYNRQ